MSTATENLQQAERNLAEDPLPRIGRVRRLVVPKNRRNKLGEQPVVLAVLPSQHFGPLHGQLTAHAGEIVARSRIDEGDLSRPPQRMRREEHSIAKGRRWGGAFQKAAPRPIDLGAQLCTVMRDERDGEGFVR